MTATSTAPSPRLRNHHAALFFTLKSASLPVSRKAQARPSRGWCPTAMIVPSARGHPAAVRSERPFAAVAIASIVSTSAVRASAVSCARASGLASTFQGSRKRVCSHAAICFACLRPLGVNLRPKSGALSSASAWRHRIKSTRAPLNKSRMAATSGLRDEMREAERSEWSNPSQAPRQCRSPANPRPIRVAAKCGVCVAALLGFVGRLRPSSRV
jgi:hypothetical protein